MNQDKTKDNFVKDITGSVLANIKAIKKRSVSRIKLFDKTVLTRIFNKDRLEAVDQIQFANEEFNPQTYTHEIFTKHDWKSIDNEWKGSLVAAREKITDELQSMVFDNYEKFIDTSKDISSFLESDVLELGGLIQDMKRSVKGLDETDLTLSIDNFGPVHVVSPEQEKIQRVEDVIIEFQCSVVARRFEDAIAICESLIIDIKKLEDELEEHYLSNIKKLKDDYVQQRNELKDVITKQLHNVSPSKTSYMISLMSRLEVPEVARDIYLRGKSNNIQLLLADVKFSGDIAEYIDETAEVVFTNIQRTGEQFTSYFSEYSHMSAFTQWITHELTKFADHFKNQAFISDDFETISKCFDLVTAHCSKLEQSGICVTFHLQQALLPEVEKARELHNLRLEAKA